ncbi:MAG TPA: energy transducer TonB [Allosphingosinicella sp.]|jgi:protein TonB
MGFALFALLSAVLAAPAAPAAADAARQGEANAAFNLYPRESLANGEQGIVSYHVRIDSRGRPTECEVTGSSGYRRLDDATCMMLMDRAQFTPSRDERGHVVRSGFDGKVVWRIG